MLVIAHSNLNIVIEEDKFLKHWGPGVMVL